MNIFRLAKAENNTVTPSIKELAKMRAAKLQAQAIVVEDILPNQRGRLKYNSTYWFGVSIDPMQSFAEGMLVKVCCREGNTLYVSSLPKALFPIVAGKKNCHEYLNNDLRQKILGSGLN